MCYRVGGVSVCPGAMGVNTVVTRDLIFDPAVPPSSINGAPSSIVITHGHADHFKFANAFRKQGSAVYAPRLCAALIEDPRVNHMATSGWAGPVDELFVTKYFLGEGTRIDFTVEPGATFEGVRAIAAPGHTPGHLVYLVETSSGRLLVAGDAVYGPSYLENNVLLYHTNTLDWLESLKRIEQLDVDALVPGHGEPAEGHRDVKELVRRNIIKVEEMLGLAYNVLPGPGEQPIYADEVAARIAETVGYHRSRRAYSVLSPTVRALLYSLYRRGLAEAVVHRGVIAWRRRL